jgi:hypothetical protein
LKELKERASMNQPIGITMFGEELTQLGVTMGLPWSEELIAYFESLGGDLFRRNAVLDVMIGGVGWLRMTP